MIVIPLGETGVIDRVREQLQAIAVSCEIEPCIRLLVNTSCEVY